MLPKIKTIAGYSTNHNDLWPCFGFLYLTVWNNDKMLSKDATNNQIPIHIDSSGPLVINFANSCYLWEMALMIANLNFLCGSNGC